MEVFISYCYCYRWGFNINCSGIWDCQGTSASVTFTGGTTVTLSGTAWRGRIVGSPMALIGANITINTPNTFTITDQIRLGNNSSITYVNNIGTIVTTGSYLIFAGTGIVINTSGMTWGNVSTGISGPNVTLTSNLNLSGTFLVGVISVINGFSIRTGGLTVSAVLSGTSTFEFVGTGTWSHTTTNSLATNVTINTPGTLTISGNVYFGTGILSYISGTVVTTGSTLNITSSCTFNTNTMNWNVINVNSTLACILTLGSNINTDTLSLAATSNALNINNAFSVYLGSLINNSIQNIQGTNAVIVFNKDGIWSHTSTGRLFLPTTINLPGTPGSTTLTLGTAVRYSTNTITYTAGTVITAGSTLFLTSGATLATNGIVWNNIEVGTGTYVLSNLLTASGNLELGTTGGTTTFSGLAGFNVGGITIGSTPATRTIIYTVANAYSVTDNFSSTGTSNAARTTFQSSSPGTKIVFTLGTSATQKLAYINATDMDSSLGQTIYSFNGVLNNTINWSTLTAQNLTGGVGLVGFVN